MFARNVYLRLKPALKKTCSCVLTSLLTAVILGMPAIHAGPEGIVRATIPFDFIVGQKTLPAGEYTVSQLGDYGTSLVVRSKDSKSAVYTLTARLQARSATNRPRLVFLRYGNKHFLAAMWRDHNEGFAIPKSTLERRLAMNQTGVGVTLSAQAR